MRIAVYFVETETGGDVVQLVLTVAVVLTRSDGAFVNLIKAVWRYFRF